MYEYVDMWNKEIILHHDGITLESDVFNKSTNLQNLSIKVNTGSCLNNITSVLSRNIFAYLYRRVLYTQKIFAYLIHAVIR